MLFIVDGTGPSDRIADRHGRTEYQREMAGSFCQRLHFQVKDSWYSRGPEILGVETRDIANSVSSRVESLKRKRPTDRVLLADHSRGGAAVIAAAKSLERICKIEAMFLFDAADRTHFFWNLKDILSNVKVCYHALRDRSWANRYRKDAEAIRRRYIKLDPTTGTPKLDRSRVSSAERRVLELHIDSKLFGCVRISYLLTGTCRKPRIIQRHLLISETAERGRHNG